MFVCLGIPILQRRSRWNTPWIALVTNSILIAIGTAFPFEFLIQMDQLFYSIGLILEHLALLWLRFKVNQELCVCRGKERERKRKRKREKDTISSLIVSKFGFQN
jgi:amino acid transporter